MNPFERCELANIPAKIKLLKDKIAKSSLVRISFHFISTTFPPTISRQSKQKKLTRMTLRILFRSTRDPKVWLNPRHTSQFLVEIIEESPKISRSLAYPFFGGDILTPPCLTHDDGTPTMKNIIGLFCWKNSGVLPINMVMFQRFTGSKFISCPGKTSISNPKLAKRNVWAFFFLRSWRMTFCWLPTVLKFQAYLFQSDSIYSYLQ